MNKEESLLDFKIYYTATVKKRQHEDLYSDEIFLYLDCVNVNILVEIWCYDIAKMLSLGKTAKITKYISVVFHTTIWESIIISKLKV